MVLVESNILRTDTPNDPVDDYIQYTLETETVISPRRKQALWERIEQEAAQQVIMVPYAVPPAPAPPHRTGMMALLHGFMSGLAVLFTDERRYQLAASHRHRYRQQAPLHLGVNGTPFSLSSLNLLHMGLH